MEDYKPNSNRFKEVQKIDEKNEKRVEKIVTNKVKVKKKSGFSKFMDGFISEDAKNVKTYVFGEVLMPAIKKAISDIITDGIDIILYGESRGNRKRNVSDRVSYRNYYDDNKPSRNNSYSNNRYTNDEVIVSTRSEAEEVVDRMIELQKTYGLVRVADLYDLVGMTGSYTDNKYGWMNVANVKINRTRDGYAIEMPKAMPLD